VLSYILEHEDGRISYPLVLINWAPACETSLLTLHASALIDFQTTVCPTFGNQIHLAHQPLSQIDVSKVLEVRDGADGLTVSALKAKLSS
jgi:hypothetical protein